MGGSNPYGTACPSSTVTEVVRIHLYATARRALGRSVLDRPVAPDGIRARDLVRALEEEFPALRRILASSRFLRNDRYLSDLSERILPGDEFAVHPPYGGG